MTSSPKQSSKKRPKIAIALQGGGSFGAFTWGVMDKLLELDLFDIEGLSGTSAGGMNALTIAQGFLKDGPQGARLELKRFWHKLQNYSVFNPYQQFFLKGLNPFLNQDSSPFGLWGDYIQNMLSPYQANPLNINPLRDIAESFFDFPLLRSAETMKAFLCATCVSSGHLEIFSLREMTLKKLLASACLPTLFHAVEIQDKYYWDGGFVGNPVLYPLIYSCETKDILVIQITTAERRDLPISSQKISNRHQEITFNACLLRELRAIDFVTQLIENKLLDEKKVKKLNMHLIQNNALFESLEFSQTLNSNWTFLEFLFQEGRKTAALWAEENGHLLGKKSTMNLHHAFG